jgi:hypothetical protein
MRSPIGFNREPRRRGYDVQKRREEKKRRKQEQHEKRLALKKEHDRLWREKHEKQD